VCICELLSGELGVPFRKLFTVQEAASELIFESPNFGLVADIGAIIDGYSLIICKEHLPSLACLDDQQFDEFANLKNEVKKIFQIAFCEPIFFEHGAASTAT